MISKAFSDTTLVSEGENHLISVGRCGSPGFSLVPPYHLRKGGLFLLLGRVKVQAFHQASAVTSLAGRDRHLWLQKPSLHTFSMDTKEICRNGPISVEWWLNSCVPPGFLIPPREQGKGTSLLPGAIKVPQVVSTVSTLGRDQHTGEGVCVRGGCSSPPRGWKCWLSLVLSYQPEPGWGWASCYGLTKMTGRTGPQILCGVCQEESIFVQKISVALSQGAPFLVLWLFSGLSWTASTGVSSLLACPISSLGYKRQKENPGDWVPYSFSVALVPSPPAFSSLSRRNSAKSIYSIFLEAKVFWCPPKLLFSFKMTFSRDSSMTGFINGQMSYFFRYWTLPHK